MHNEVIIRKEKAADEREVETVTREAFWNLFVPGCNEHYLAHILRFHKDFMPDLSYVAELDGRIIGNIMYARSWVVDENGATLNTLTFGPVSVHPKHQRRGIGSMLIVKTIEEAKAKNEPAIIIYGSPSNYCKFGFKSAKDFNISTQDGKYPFGMLALELKEGVLENRRWMFRESEVYNVDVAKAEEFDALFEHKEKMYRYTQEEFKISCRAFIE
jgi:predicted N-acetyltransferase YhbS